MKRLLSAAVFGVFWGGCLGGCVTKHQGDYSWGFEVSTGYKFRQTAPETEPATVEVDVNPLVENIIDLGWAKADDEPEGED